MCVIFGGIVFISSRLWNLGGKCVRVCAWMRACVHGCVYTYAFIEVGVPHVDVECVRACVYAQIKGMVVLLVFMEWGE